MINNITIRMKSEDSITVAEHQIDLIGENLDKVISDLKTILNTKEILGIYDLEEELENIGYEPKGVTGEIILTIYESLNETIIRIQKEIFINPSDFGVEMLEGDVFEEYQTIGFIKVKQDLSEFERYYNL